MLNKCLTLWQSMCPVQQAGLSPCLCWVEALGVTEAVTVPSEVCPARHSLPLTGHGWCCCAGSGRSFTASLALGHIRRALIPLLLKSAVFGIGFSEPSPKLPLCLPWFSLVAPLPLSGSPGFSGSQRCGGLKEELQLISHYHPAIIYI